MTSERLAVVVLISGRGSNLQAIIDAAGDSDCPFTVSAVISNQPGAAGLERARRAGIPVDDALILWLGRFLAVCT